MQGEAEPRLPSQSDNSLGDYLPFFLRMSEARETSVRGLLLVRRGVALLPDGVGPSRNDAVRAVELELAAVGYVVSARHGPSLVTGADQHLVGRKPEAVIILA